MQPDIALFQKRLRDTRGAQGLTLQQVADGSGLTKSYVWELEKGRVANPTVRAVWSLAGALGVTPAYLIGLDPNVSELDPMALKIAAIINVELNRRSNPDDI